MAPRNHFAPTEREDEEALLLARARRAAKTLRHARKQLRHEDPAFGRDVQEDGMLRQANPHTRGHR